MLKIPYKIIKKKVGNKSETKLKFIKKKKKNMLMKQINLG